MIFSSRRSFLLRKRITDECWNHGYVIIVLNKALLSSIRFCKKKSIHVTTILDIDHHLKLKKKPALFQGLDLPLSSGGT
jgi:hypothetical protein